MSADGLPSASDAVAAEERIRQLTSLDLPIEFCLTDEDLLDGSTGKIYEE